MLEAREPVTSTLPYHARSEKQRFELTLIDRQSLSGSFIDLNGTNRFEIWIEHRDGTSQWISVLATLPYIGRTPDLLGRYCSFSVDLDQEFQSATFKFRRDPSLNFTLKFGPDGLQFDDAREAAPKQNLVLFDVSDLVYYIGHHDNLTGIQRVQACVLMGLLRDCPTQPRGYITFDNRRHDFLLIDSSFFEALLEDLALPVATRRVQYDHLEARLGILPNSTPLSAELNVASEQRLVIYLLGAAWVNRDYFHRILDLKRAYNAIFCMTIHDLIPIFARETCDQGTATVFEEFLRKSFLFTDHYFTVSENTAVDLHRFAASLDLKNIPVSVVENGHALDEFFPPKRRKTRAPIQSDYVLFVSTVEGRKNHSYIFDVWARLAETSAKVPVLVCVGRFGWRAEQFLEKMLMSGNLNNKIRVMSDVSDSQLAALYEHCLFTVYPSLYEGWGLPVGESLCQGKLCVLSNRSSLPEVAGEFGVYIDIDSVEDGAEKIGKLIDDAAHRKELEQALKTRFVPRTWKKVAKELVDYLNQLPNSVSERFPITKLGREYKLAQLPPRNFSALGYAMIAEVSSARKAPITGYINRDEDLLYAQAMRDGQSWYAPEDWGTWSRYPETSKLFYVAGASQVEEVVIYEKLRVVPPLIGHTLRTTVNDGAPQDFAIDEENFVIRVVGQVRADATGTAPVSIRYELKGSPEVIPELDQIDSRRLGLGFESTAIVDDQDLRARIAMVEKLIFGGSAGRFGGSSADSRIRAIGSGSRGAERRKEGRGSSASVPSASPIGDAGDQRSLSSTIIEIGEEVRFAIGEAARSGETTASLLGRGWYPLEDASVWSHGAEATLHFRLSPDTKPVFVMALSLRCLASAERRVRMTVALNNVVVGTEEFQDLAYRELHFVVDQNVTPEDRAFVMLLHSDRPGSPRDFGFSDDARELGINIRSLCAKPLPSLTLQERFRVNKGCAIINAFAGGWYPPEDNGVWSQPEGGRIIGSLNMGSRGATGNVKLSIVGRVYGTAATGPALVDLLVQGQPSATWTFDDDEECFKQAILPLTALDEGHLLDVRIVRRGSISPSEIGQGGDNRKLGLLIAQVTFDTATLAAGPADNLIGD